LSSNVNECKLLAEGEQEPHHCLRHVRARLRAGQPGKAVQVDPINPTLKAPGPQHLILKYDKLLSTCAFKFNLRRYNPIFAAIELDYADADQDATGEAAAEAGPFTRPSFGST